MLRVGRISLSRGFLTSSRGSVSSASAPARGLAAVTSRLGLVCVGSATVFSLGSVQGRSVARCDMGAREKKERSLSSLKQRRRSRRFMRRLRKKIVAWIEMFLRSIYLSLVFAPAAITLPIALVMSGIDQEDVNVKTRGAWWWSLLRNCIRNSGPCTM